MHAGFSDSIPERCCTEGLRTGLGALGLSSLGLSSLGLSSLGLGALGLGALGLSSDALSAHKRRHLLMVYIDRVC